MLQEITGGIGSLVKPRRYFNNECMIILYNAFIYLYLIYCNRLLDSTSFKITSVPE